MWVRVISIVLFHLFVLSHSLSRLFYFFVLCGQIRPFGTLTSNLSYYHEPLSITIIKLDNSFYTIFIINIFINHY